MTDLDDLQQAIHDKLPSPIEPDAVLASQATVDAPRCRRCGRLPESLPVYRDLVSRLGVKAARTRVRNDEGTYNAETGGFWCDECYIALGCPVGTAP
jgi:hypothetical protein